MKQNRQTIDRLEAAEALGVHPRTLTNNSGKPYNKSTARLPLVATCRAIRCKPEWLMACLTGRDRALKVAEAARALGISDRQVITKSNTRKTLKPAAIIGRGVRFSAVELGVMRTGPSVCGHPSSNQPWLGGNSMED